MPENSKNPFATPRETRDNVFKLRLTDSELAAIEAAAKRKGVPATEIFRDALAVYFSQPKPKAKR